MRFLITYRPEMNQVGGCAAGGEKAAEMGKLVEEQRAAGILLATEGLLPIASGARVRLSGGKITVTDGATVACENVIAGFAIVRADSKGEAIANAERFIRIAGDGETEIRQLFEPTDFCAEASAEAGAREQRTGI